MARPCLLVAAMVLLCICCGGFPVHPIRNKRLTLSDYNEFLMHDEVDGPGTYAFNYDIEEPESGNIQFRTEERFSNGTVSGSYGFVTPEGVIQIVHYVADQLGYRAKVETRGSGYLKNNRGDSGPEPSWSPEMRAAINSLKHYNRNQIKYDRRTRPIDEEYERNRINSMNTVDSYDKVFNNLFL